jgi:hypothetical protein
MRDGTPALRAGKDGYCVCFDRKNRKCAIYSVRPGDCRLFPFDFYQDARGRFRWLMWDCPLSRRLTETDIRKSLTRLERRYAGFIEETWAYGLDDYPNATAPAHRPKTRILRPLRLLGGHPPPRRAAPGLCRP